MTPFFRSRKSLRAPRVHLAAERLGAFTGPVEVQPLDVNGDGLLDVVARATINGKKRTRTFTT